MKSVRRVLLMNFDPGFCLIGRGFAFILFILAELFCTGDRAQAARHSDVYLVFPAEGFQFCWSPWVADLHDWAVKNDRLSVNPNEFVGSLNELDTIESDLAAAAASSSELLVLVGATTRS